MSTLLLRGAVVFLIAMGVTGAVHRIVNVAARPDPPVPGQSVLSPPDEAILEWVAGMRGLEPGSNAYRDYQATILFSFAKYHAHPLATFLHLVPGSLFLLLGALQFSSPLRTRHPRLHRWTGRLLLVAAVPTGLSAIFFGLLASAAVPTASVFFGGFFLYAAIRAFLFIRRRDVLHHREWMIRAFAVALAVSTVRLVGAVLFLVTRAGPERVAEMSFWSGGLISLAAAEWWIHATRTHAADRVFSPARNS